MDIKDIKFTFIAMEPTDAIKNYGMEKITKHANFFERATSTEITLKNNKQNKGISNDFELEVRVSLPKGFVNVNEKGNDLYALIDKASEVLVKRFNRYFDKFNQWEGKQPWKVIEAEELLNDIEEEGDIEMNYVDYTPRVTKRSKMLDMRPMEEAEAIEQMELVGEDHFLFKHIKTGNISLIYKCEGGYGLIEPDSDL